MKKYLIFLLVSLVVYSTSLSFGFSQDDYFFLVLSRAETFRDVLNFFSPFNQNGFPFYRPLATQFYFYISKLLFPENTYIFMHSFTLLIHSLNGYLTYKLATILKINKTKSFLAGIIYTSSAVHFLTIYYLAATQQLLAATFSILTIIYYLKSKKIHSSIFLFLALLSKENAILTPLLILILEFGYLRKNFLESIRKTLYLSIPIILYLILRLSSGIVVQSQYHPDISLKLFSSILFYWQFTHSAPEEIIRYGLGNGLVNYAQFIKDMGFASIMTSITAFLSIFISTFSIIKSLIDPRARRITISLLLWWISAIALIIWFPDHRYPHYLDLSLLGFSIMLMKIMKEKLAIIFTLLILLGSYFSVSLSVDNHWTTNRAKIAESATKILLETSACNAEEIIFKGENNYPLELSYALSIGNAINFICDREIPTYYTDFEESKMLQSQISVYEVSKDLEITKIE